MKEKTVLFVMPRLPFPATSGRKNSLFYYCKIISEKLGYRLVVAAFLENGDNPKDKPDFIDRLEILATPSNIEKIKNIILNSLMRKRYPLQVALYKSEKANERIKTIIQEENPDILIGDMVRSVEYIKDFNKVSIADLDDLISIRYKRQLKTDIDGVNPYGAFIDTLPKPVKKVLLFKWVKKAVLTREIDLLSKYELLAGKLCSSSVLVAEKETRYFNRILGREKAVTIPIGVDTDYFSYRVCGNKNTNVIGFLGALNVAHNENAVKYFSEKIFPKILKEIPDAVFMVIGGGASEELKRYSSSNIIFTGRVDDVRDYMEKCNVFVCPLKFGSGIKTKNLEAMSLGLPVITTTIGAENIGASSGKDWIITNKDFSVETIAMLKNREKQLNMGINASLYVKNNFTWEKAEKQWRKLLK